MSSEETPTTDDELHDELMTLLQEAHANGVDVEGGWACHNGADVPDWDVVITEVVKR